MLIRVNNRFSPVEIDFSQIESVEDLMKKMRIDNLYPNSFQIISGTAHEVFYFIDFFMFDNCRVIKNFYGQELSFFYNPYQQTNDILIHNTDLFNEVRSYLEKTSKFEPNK